MDSFTGNTPNLYEVGSNNATFEVDYPHTDSTRPNTEVLAKEMFAELSDKEIDKVSRGNAIRMLHLGLDKAPSSGTTSVITGPTGE